MGQDKKRYEKIKSCPGIRKELKTGKFEAYKTISGKKYSKTFDQISKAKEWRLNFFPKNVLKIESRMKFEDLLLKYQEEHVLSLSSSTKGVRIDRMKMFEDLKKYYLDQLSPDFFVSYFKTKKLEAIESKSQRKTFREEIKILKSMFNWYRENIDYKFINPIFNKRLLSSSTISKDKKVINKMSLEELLSFFENLDGLFKDLAIIHSRLAGRIGEIAGLQFKSIDFNKMTLDVEYVAVWGRNKKFLELKSLPKNESKRGCVITEDMKEILNRRILEKSPNSDYVFHIDGEPLSYRTIQHQYNTALKKANLYGKFTSTHFLRHAMAFLTRSYFDLEHVQAVTGHKSLSMAQQYGGLPTDKQAAAINLIEKKLKEVGKGGQTKKEDENL